MQAGEHRCGAVQGGGLVMEHVDWIVCNSGADIWHNFREAQDKTGWHADEAWEEHINFRCLLQCFPRHICRLGLHVQMCVHDL